jgi:hypothetical protein
MHITEGTLLVKVIFLFVESNVLQSYQISPSAPQHIRPLRFLLLANSSISIIVTLLARKKHASI